MPYLRKKIAVLGLGEESRDVLAWLKTDSRACQVTVIDPFKNQDLTGYNLIFRSTGIWRLHSRILAAKTAGAEISSATKLFFRLCPCPIIGVTGTKGKGTTASLIRTILTAGGKQGFLAGNIGRPMLALLPQLYASSFICLELSSFQLQDLTISPHIAVVLNITQDHLDIHRSLQEYRQAKTNLVRWQTPADHAVINRASPVSRSFSRLTRAQIHWFNDRLTGLDLKQLQLIGRHNLENISAALTVAAICGIPRPVALRAVYNFKGLEHRLELVREFQEVRYYNDSASTTPETAIAAIKAFTQPLVIILGGSDKRADYSLLGKTIITSKQVKAVVLIGKMGPKIGEALAGFPGKIIKGARSMKQILNQAKAVAAAGDVVLLSPGCASFDLFKNYRDRGEQFKKNVNQLH